MQPSFNPAARPVPRVSMVATACEGGDADFVLLLDAYRPSGGVARKAEVANLLRQGGERGAHVVTGWIVCGEVLRFRWHEEDWLPMFQFARPGMNPRPALRRVRAELESVLDDWDLARWFARPNPWLGGAVPAELFATQAVQVEQAARADRFAFRG